MLKSGETKSGAEVFDGDRHVSCPVGDCAGEEVGIWIVCAGVIKLRHLFGVEEVWKICKGVP